MSKDNEMTMIDQAVELNAKLDVGIIPLASRSKRPAEADWNNKGRYSEADIRDALEGREGYGVLCEGITVVDFDPRNMDVRDPEDESEVEYMIHLIREAYDLGETFEVVTGSAGTHLYFRGETKPGKLKDVNGVDIKTGKKHQVVGPGSKHPGTGRDYRIWREAPMADLATTRLPLKSTSANELALPELGGVVEFESADIPEDGFGEGDRNNGLYRHLCKVRAMGLDDRGMETYAQVINKRHISPPLPTDEVETLAAQANKHTPGTMALSTLTQDSIQAVLGEADSGPEGWITLDDLDGMEPPEYLIEGVLPAKGVGHLVGESYAGKTFIALDMALSLVSKTVKDWMGHAINEHEHRVAYIAMEGGFDLGQRVRAWRNLNGEVPKENLRLLVEQPFDLMTEDGLKALKDLKGFNPSVLVIDTQSLAAPRANENDNSDMTALMSSVKLISQSLGCLVILVHHAGYSADRARGASAQFANMDVSLYVEGGKKQDDLRTLKVTKLKSGRLPDDMLFKLTESGSSVVATHYKGDAKALTEANPEMFESMTLADCKSTPQKVLLALRDGEARDKEAIADAIDMRERTVGNHLKTLVKSRQIEEVTPYDRGTGTPATYRLKATENSDGNAM